jgi:hypothetical protein
MLTAPSDKTFLAIRRTAHTLPYPIPAGLA